MVSQIGEKTVTQTIPQEVEAILNYPSKLKDLYVKLKTPTYTITQQDLIDAQPPASLTPEATIQKAVEGASKFLYNHYGKEGNYWRGGDLTAQLFPIAISAGTLLPTYLGKWKILFQNKALSSTRLSKIGKIFRMEGLLNEEAVAAKLIAGAEIESVTITTSTGTEIEQTIFRNETKAVDNIYEEIDDLYTDGQKKVIKICGLCLAQNTKVFGSNQTIAELNDANSQVQTLEKDGSVSVRKVLGKYSRKVSDYVKVFVGGEELKSSSDHAFKTNKGWFSAGSLRKGMMLFSLALNSFVPVDSMAFINEPLQVEGLALGNVEGYGVSRLGILVAPTRPCFVKFTNNIYIEIENVVTEAEANKFYTFLDKEFENTTQKVASQITSVERAGEVSYSWTITNSNVRKTIVSNIRALPESKIIAQKYWVNNAIAEYKIGYTNFDDWYNDIFLNKINRQPNAAFEAHHILPIDVLETNENLQKIIKWAKDNGKANELRYNNIENGIMVAKKKINDVEVLVPGHANHPTYTNQIKVKLNGPDVFNPNNMQNSFDNLKDYIENIRQKIKTQVVEGDTNINDLIL